MSARGLILDGVTGAGKTHVLDACARRGGWFARATIVLEDETLGEAMDEELRDAPLQGRSQRGRGYACRALSCSRPHRATPPCGS
jgi:hypothetical protein